MCSLHLTHPSGAAPGEQSGVRCLAQGSHLSREHFLPEPGFEPTTLGPRKPRKERIHSFCYIIKFFCAVGYAEELR